MESMMQTVQDQAIKSLTGSAGQPAAGKHVAGQSQAEEMNRMSIYNAAPVTGISCALIEVLPTMALPMPDMMAAPMVYSEDFTSFML